MYFGELQNSRCYSWSRDLNFNFLFNYPTSTLNFEAPLISLKHCFPKSAPVHSSVNCEWILFYCAPGAALGDIIVIAQIFFINKKDFNFFRIYVTILTFVNWKFYSLIYLDWHLLPFIINKFDIYRVKKKTWNLNI